MSETDFLKPADRYSAETITEYRAAGHWRDESLAGQLEHWAKVQGDQRAISDGYGELSWRELHEQSLRLARRLHELGIGQGDRVQVQLPNWVEFVVIYAALGRLGAVLVPTMPIYRWDEVRYAINHAGAKISIVCGEFRRFDYRQMIADVRPDCPTLEHVITVRCDSGDDELRFEDLVAETQETQGTQGTGDVDLGPLPSADDPHAIIYTSGTESRPKGCYHTFNTFGYTVHNLGGDVMGLGPGDVMFMPSPISHATGLVMGVTTPIVLGCGMHLMDVWEPAKALEQLREYGCTASMAATPFVQMVMDTYESGTHDLSALRLWVSAGAPIPETLLREWRTKLPSCGLLPVYGRSEGLLVTSCRQDDSEDKVVSSDGRALPGVVLEIRGEDGNPVEAGEEGEICHGGPGLMLGYWRDPDRTAEAIDGAGVSRSGDLGRVDAEGYMRVTGRIKDLIIRGGTNISAREVEEHLLTHPKVSACAVVGMPDRVLGERACAFVVAADPSDPPGFDELTSYLRNERKIAVVKLPERLEVIDELPTTATGKVQKFVLRAKLVDS